MPALRQRTTATHPGQRRDGKATGVAVAIEHAGRVQPRHVFGKQMSAVSLIEIKARLVPFHNIQRQLPVVLSQGQFGARFVTRWATQPPRRRGQSLELTHARVRTLIQAAQPGQRQQGVRDGAFPTLGATGEKLRHQGVAIAVHDQPRQAV